MIERMCAKLGGTLHATASGQLPCSEKNESPLSSKGKVEDKIYGYKISTMQSDDLFTIMQRAHAKYPTSKFIRSIRATDPAIMLADDTQITDMARFCTSGIEFGILTVDPTFSWKNSM